MKKILGFCCLAFAVVLSPAAIFAATGAPYENTDRHMGTVSELFSTTVGGHPWVAFVVTHPDGSPARYDCDTRATLLGCTLVNLGDYVLVNGHAEQYGSGLSCRWDGADYLLVPNIVYNCNAWLASHGVAPCVQLTP